MCGGGGVGKEGGVRQVVRLSRGVQSANHPYSSRKRGSQPISSTLFPLLCMSTKSPLLRCPHGNQAHISRRLGPIESGVLTAKERVINSHRAVDHAQTEMRQANPPI